MRYIKIPRVVGAVQLTINNIMEVYKFIHDDDNSLSFMTWRDTDRWYDYMDIVKRDGMWLDHTDDENRIATIGDYVVRDNGKFYVCSEEVFNRTYQKYKESDN